jgi:hypothetical protein
MARLTFKPSQKTSYDSFPNMCFDCRIASGRPVPVVAGKARLPEQSGERFASARVHLTRRNVAPLIAERAAAHGHNRAALMCERAGASYGAMVQGASNRAGAGAAVRQGERLKLPASRPHGRHGAVSAGENIRPSDVASQALEGKTTARMKIATTNVSPDEVTGAGFCRGIVPLYSRLSTLARSKTFHADYNRG